MTGLEILAESLEHAAKAVGKSVPWKEQAVDLFGGALQRRMQTCSSKLWNSWKTKGKLCCFVKCQHKFESNG
jgi:hypothetical protein